MAANSRGLKSTVANTVAKGQTFFKVKNQPISNGITKSSSIINSIKNTSEKTSKTDQSSINSSNEIIANCDKLAVRANVENCVLNENNLSSTCQKSNDSLESNNKIECEVKEKTSSNQLNSSQKLEVKSTKIVNSASSDSESMQTVDVRDLKRVFKKPPRDASVPPIPLRRKWQSSSRSNIPNDTAKESNIKKSTSTSNVLTNLSKKYQDSKERSSSFRYLIKTKDTPINSRQSTYNDTRSLSRNSIQYNKYSSTSIKPYSVEKSLEILKSPSAKINSSTSSSHLISKSIYRPNEKITDNNITSSRVSEVWTDRNREHSSTNRVTELLEAEMTERMKLEKQVIDLQSRCSQIRKRTENMEAKVTDDEDEANSIYRQKYERIVKELEISKKRMQQQLDEEMENQLMIKKAADKKLAEALEDLEEEKRVSSQWKRKAQKINNELQNQRMITEEEMARNAELEKKQRKLDAELSNRQEEIMKEQFLREKIEREKDVVQREKHSIEQELHSIRLDAEMQSEKIVILHKELEALSGNTYAEEEITALKRMKQELERKCRSQEEELEDLISQGDMLEQAKVRLERTLEKAREEYRRESSVREEEIEELRAAMHKKLKNLEAQLENEQEERQKVLKHKHDLERQIMELNDQPPPHDPEIERRLRRELKRTKALLKDSQITMEHIREGQANKSIVRQLKSQIEEAEFMKTAAIKAKQFAEMELQDVQLQLEDLTRAKCDIESRSIQLSREKSALHMQLEEMDEELAEVMKKYKSVVLQMSSDQKLLVDQNQQISELESEKKILKEQLLDLSRKMEQQMNEQQPDDSYQLQHLEGKISELETKLELEQTTRNKLENQLHRLKEQSERMKEECDIIRNKELQSQECIRRLQRQQRELREECSSLKQKESEAYQKHRELEMALENSETDLQITRNELRLSYQRIQDLQNALEDDTNSETDVVAEGSGSESDDNHSIQSRQQYYVPTHRGSVSSCGGNYEMFNMSRSSSFGYDSAAQSLSIQRTKRLKDEYLFNE